MLIFCIEKVFIEGARDARARDLERARRARAAAKRIYFPSATPLCFANSFAVMLSCDLDELKTKWRVMEKLDMNLPVHLY